jgi:4-amino-4-deoxy-L-arabinose transferase-like glycosyltransferase
MQLHQRVTFVFMLVVALALRLIGLGDAGLGFDEPQHIYAARAWLATGEPVLPSGMVYDRALPFTQLVAGSLALFGDGIFAARLPSALFGTATVALVFQTGRLLFGFGIGLLAMFLVAALPFELTWARTCRMYAVYQFFYLLAIYAFYRGFEARPSAPDPLTRLLNRLPWGARLTFQGEIGAAWLVLSAAALVCALLLHDLAVVIGVSVLVYALLGAGIEAMHSGRGVAARSKYTFLAAAVVVVGALRLLMPGELEQVTKNLLFRPSWIGDSQPEVLFYLNFLNTGAQFPLGLFLLLGAVQGWLRMDRGALFLAACSATPIAFHSLIAPTQSPRYIYDCLPLVILLSAYAGWNLFTMERERLERSGSLLRTSPRDRFVSSATIGALLFGCFVLAPPAIRNGTRRALGQGVAFGGEYNVDWAGACRFVRDESRPGDTLIASIPLAATYAGCPKVAYNLDNGELDQFRDLGARLPHHSFADAAAIVDLKALQFVLGQGGRFWLLLDAQRLQNTGNTPADVRAFIDHSFTLRWTSPDGTVSVYQWGMAPAGAPKTE